MSLNPSSLHIHQKKKKSLRSKAEKTIVCNKTRSHHKACSSKPGTLDTPVIPALGRLRQVDHNFKVSTSYIARCCLKKISKIKK
jgi:hypothetical protein